MKDHKTTILIPMESVRALKISAINQNKSMASIIRQAVTEYLKKDTSSVVKSS